MEIHIIYIIFRTNCKLYVGINIWTLILIGIIGNTSIKKLTAIFAWREGGGDDWILIL